MKQSMTLGGLLTSARATGFMAKRDRSNNLIKKDCPMCAQMVKQVMGENNNFPWIDTKQVLVMYNVNNPRDILHACPCGYRHRPGTKPVTPPVMNQTQTGVTTTAQQVTTPVAQTNGNTFNPPNQTSPAITTPNKTKCACGNALLNGRKKYCYTCWPKGGELLVKETKEADLQQTHPVLQQECKSVQQPVNQSVQQTQPVPIKNRY